MTELKKLIEKTVEEIVPIKEVREAIFEAIHLEQKFGSSKSIDLLGEYEKIIEGLTK